MNAHAHATSSARMEIQFPKCACPSNFRSGICLCPGGIDRRIGGSSDCETRENRERTKPGLSPLSRTDNG